MRTSLIPVPSVALMSAAQPAMVTEPAGSVCPSDGLSTTPRTSHSAGASWWRGAHSGAPTRRAPPGPRPRSAGRSAVEVVGVPAIASPRPVSPLASTTASSTTLAIRGLGPCCVTARPPPKSSAPEALSWALVANTLGRIAPRGGSVAGQAGGRARKAFAFYRGVQGRGKKKWVARRHICGSICCGPALFPWKRQGVNTYQPRSSWRVPREIDGRSALARGRELRRAGPGSVGPVVRWPAARQRVGGERLDRRGRAPVHVERLAEQHVLRHEG